MKQTFAPIRKNLDCGFDPNNISSGREPCQMGWYDYISKKYCSNKTVLDVGCGMAKGIDLMVENGCKEVYGQEIDSRLEKIHRQIIIKNISEFEDESYDCVTCFDVIEHVMDDYEFFTHLLRITKKYLFITTPNFTRSRAQNHCHCREYSIPQFLKFFKPDELWVGAPDGKSHITKLLEKKELDVWFDFTRNKFYNIDQIKEDLSFTHSTVDGLEWPHILGVFRVGVE